MGPFPARIIGLALSVVSLPCVAQVRDIDATKLPQSPAFQAAYRSGQGLDPAQQDKRQKVAVISLPAVSISQPQKTFWDDVLIWGPWVFNLLLAIVGGLQIWMLFRTWEEIRKQETRMGEQVEAMKSQLAQMTEQTSILKDSVAASNKSADAANSNIELVIKKERARLSVEIGALNPSCGIFECPVIYTLTHHGPTDARTVMSTAGIEVTDSEEPPRVSGYGMISQVFTVITPNDRVHKIESPLLYRFSKEEISLIENRERFVYFVGIVRYLDIFDKQHETTWAKRWRITNLKNMPQGFFAYWENCGRPEANRET